jgi:hypothetical protein
MLPAQEYALVEEYARERGISVSALLRDVVGRTLIAQLRERRRRTALRRLTGQNLPVADWEEIEGGLDTLWAGHEPG